MCAADEYVSSNSCVSCSAGTINDAGDDASGSDTVCDVAGCMTTSDCAYDSNAAVHDESACSGLSAGSCNQCSLTTSQGSCSDIPGFLDSYSDTCSAYAANTNYCNNASVWENSDGVDASEACCACGGGTSSGGSSAWALVNVSGGDTDGDGVCDDNEITGLSLIHI